MADESVELNKKNPDLDWSQVKETVMMLNLAVMQIERTLNEGDESINALTDTFASLIGGIQAIGMAAENLPYSPEKSTIETNIKPSADKISSAIVAFQFYDKLSQRLNHVSHSLDALGKLIENPARLYSPYEWHGLQAMIKSNYTVKQDRDMFDAILKGASVQEALSLIAAEDSDEDDEIELF